MSSIIADTMHYEREKILAWVEEEKEAMRDAGIIDFEKAAVYHCQKMLKKELEFLKMLPDRNSWVVGRYFGILSALNKF